MERFLQFIYIISILEKLKKKRMPISERNNTKGNMFQKYFKIQCMTKLYSVSFLQTEERAQFRGLSSDHTKPLCVMIVFC